MLFQWDIFYCYHHIVHQLNITSYEKYHSSLLAFMIRDNLSADKRLALSINIQKQVCLWIYIYFWHWFVSENMNCSIFDWYYQIYVVFSLWQKFYLTSKISRSFMKSWSSLFPPWIRRRIFDELRWFWGEGGGESRETIGPIGWMNMCSVVFKYFFLWEICSISFNGFLVKCGSLVVKSGWFLIGSLYLEFCWCSW